MVVLCAVAACLALALTLVIGAREKNDAAWADDANAAPKWAIIGDATSGGWSTDTDLTFDSSSNLYYIKNYNLSVGDLKFKINDGTWDTNYGSSQHSVDILQLNSDNIPVTTAGQYDIYLDPSGARGWIVNPGTALPTTKYTVTYKLGNNSSAEAITFKTDNEFLYSINEQHIEGCYLLMPMNSHLNGASSSLSCFTDSQYGDGEFISTASNSTIALTSDRTLYAIYQGQTNSITYKTNDGSWEQGFTPTSQYTHNHDTVTTITLPDSTKISKPGKVFAGWYEKSDFSGQALTQIDTKCSKDFTFYAKWEDLPTHQVSGKLIDAGRSAVGDRQVTFTYDDTTKETLTTTTADDGTYSFNVEENQAGTITFDNLEGEGVVKPIHVEVGTAPVTLEDQISRHAYTAIFKITANKGGSIIDDEGTEVEETSLLEGSTISTEGNKLAINYPEEYGLSRLYEAKSNDGYCFDKWEINETQTNLLFANTYSADQPVKANTTITAAFSANQPIVPENDANGEVTNETPSTGDSTPFVGLACLVVFAGGAAVYALRKRTQL